ncbi:Scr1 family TA system antitoxin-like transcriptional regulator [Streptomyces sp. NPDC102264]|uniref:Scr1 family TA system antitoxin-like transcriptional regulator n=1 Tax=Streptomyces sp. NPDC102264 TaxID=3366149 RepID=UPI0038208E5B
MPLGGLGSWTRTFPCAAGLPVRGAHGSGDAAGCSGTGVGGPFNILSFADEGAVDVIHMDGLGSTVWVEGEQESAAYAQLFGRLCAASLSPYDSVQLIEGIGKEMSE